MRSDFLGVTPTVSHPDLIKAFRKKSKQIHPDKVKRSFIASYAKPKKGQDKNRKPGVHVSKGPSDKEIQRAVKQATERYARLGIVADILKGPGRDRYNHFLNNGFPIWKGTGYYYSRFRPGLGTVLIGLFLSFGGAAHYGALILSWKRQRAFVDRYIRHARRAAWGDELGIKGLPGTDSGNVNAPASSVDTGEGAVAMNRRQKRQMDRGNKKESKKGKAPKSSGTSTPTEGGGEGDSPTPSGERKRVMAENGKVLIVDSIGNVFLEEENEEGETQEFLLDISDIPRPTFRDTAVFQLPPWIVRKALGRLFGSARAEPEDSIETEIIVNNADQEITQDVASNGRSKGSGNSRKRKGN